MRGYCTIGSVREHTEWSESYEGTDLSTHLVFPGDEGFPFDARNYSLLSSLLKERNKYIGKEKPSFPDESNYQKDLSYRHKIPIAKLLASDAIFLKMKLNIIQVDTLKN